MSKVKSKAIKFFQGNSELYIFAAKASDLWRVLSINKRDEDKERGYQRALSTSRADDLRKFIEAGKPVAPAIIISLDHARFNEQRNEITIDDRPDAGWVIDGQHRLRGAQLASKDGKDVMIPVVAFIGLDEQSQVFQFVTINREAKGVPTSLYYDLLKYLPSKKTSAEVAKEKAADIANVLRKDQGSPFFERIVTVTSPKKGQISMTNFVRKIYPLLSDKSGKFNLYSQKEVVGILNNYFKALKIVFPNEFDYSKPRFFATLGFGAIINALPTVFDLTLKESETYSFRVEDIKNLLVKASDFNFQDWDNLGTGSQAEIQAGRDLETYIKQVIADSTGTSGSLTLE